MIDKQDSNQRVNTRPTFESTVAYWWKHKFLIIKVLVPLALLYTAVLLALPSKYKANASVIIMPPRFAPEVRASTLTVPTARAILDTPELYLKVLQTVKRHREIITQVAGSQSPVAEQLSNLASLTPADISSASSATQAEAEVIAIYDKSELKGLLGFTEAELAKLNVDSMSRKFSSEESVDKKTASDVIFSPVLQLYATGSTGEQAQVLVNIWARLFEEKYETIAKGQTTRLFASLENQQKAGRAELEKIQKQMVDFQLKNNLDLVQRLIRDKTEQLSSFTHQLTTKNTQYATLGAQQQALLQASQKLELPGQGWIGEIQPDLSTSTLPLQLTIGRHTDDHAPTITLLQTETLTSLEHYTRSMATAQQFHATNSVELVRSEEQKLREQLISEKEVYRENLIKIASLEKTLGDVDAQLAGTSRTLRLTTSFPAEVIGNSLLSANASNPHNLASARLDNEQLNPVWQTLSQSRVELQQQLAQARAQASELSKVFPEREQTLATLSSKVFNLVQQDTLIKAAVSRNEKVNDTLFANYLDLKTEQLGTALKLTLLHEEISAHAGSVDQLTSEIEQLRQVNEVASRELELLNLSKKAIEERAQLLTEKLQESTVALGEQVNDVSMASRAVAPARHYFPPRAILLAIMTALSAAILLAGLARRHHLEQQGA